MTIHGYPVTRKATERFKGRAAYFGSKIKATTFEPEMCQVMEHVTGNGGWGGRHDDTGWRGFPWLTLVLGSGCLELPDDPRFTPEGLAAAVAERVRCLLGDDDCTGAGEEPLSTQTATFALHLVRDRTHPDVRPDAQPPAPPEPDGEVDEVAARMLLVAALLTRFYFGVKGASGTPISRWENDRVSCRLTDARPSVDMLVESVIARSIEQIGQIRQALACKPARETGGIETAISNMLADVAGGLACYGAPELSFAHLRLVTESAWYMLTNDSMYPGWSDVLLGLMLREGRAESDGYPRSRPRYLNLRLMPQQVRNLYSTPTAKSWKRWTGVAPGAPPVTERNRFYTQAADVLWEQARLVASGTGSFPPASAFVTSFDIEPEMALWTTGVARSGTGPFFVVVPVHVLRHEYDDQAALCWLRGEITPDATTGADDAERLLLQPRNWTVLSGVPHDGYGKGPHVVHLSGCPLFELPTGAALGALVDELAAAGVHVDADRVHVQHAVTVDEYLAFRQSEAETYWSAHVSKEATVPRGLPHVLLGSSTDSTAHGQNPRFWMAFGVPVSDVAVRHRIVSQITVKQLRSGASPPGPPPEASRLGKTEAAVAPEEAWRAVDGVVVNLRVNEDEANILYWIGLDVVGDDSRSFIRDLEHYAHHLRAADPVRPSLFDPCPLTRRTS